MGRLPQSMADAFKVIRSTVTLKGTESSKERKKAIWSHNKDQHHAMASVAAFNWPLVIEVKIPSGILTAMVNVVENKESGFVTSPSSGLLMCQCVSALVEKQGIVPPTDPSAFLRIFGTVGDSLRLAVGNSPRVKIETPPSVLAALAALRVLASKAPPSAVVTATSSKRFTHVFKALATLLREDSAVPSGSATGKDPSSPSSSHSKKYLRSRAARPGWSLGMARAAVRCVGAVAERVVKKGSEWRASMLPGLLRLLRHVSAHLPNTLSSLGGSRPAPGVPTGQELNEILRTNMSVLGAVRACVVEQRGISVDEVVAPFIRVLRLLMVHGAHMDYSTLRYGFNRAPGSNLTAHPQSSVSAMMSSAVGVTPSSPSRRRRVGGRVSRSSWAASAPPGISATTSSTKEEVSVFTVIEQDPDPKLRAQAASVLATLFKDAKGYLGLAIPARGPTPLPISPEVKTAPLPDSSPAPRKKSAGRLPTSKLASSRSSYVSLADRVSALARSAHSRLCGAISSETSVSVTHSLLRSAAVVVLNTPYHDMEPGYLSGILLTVQPFLGCRCDPQTQGLARAVIRAALGSKTLLPDSAGFLTQLRSAPAHLGHLIAPLETRFTDTDIYTKNPPPLVVMPQSAFPVSRSPLAMGGDPIHSTITEELIFRAVAPCSSTPTSPKSGDHAVGRGVSWRDGEGSRGSKPKVGDLQASLSGGDPDSPCQQTEALTTLTFAVSSYLRILWPYMPVLLPGLQAILLAPEGGGGPFPVEEGGGYAAKGKWGDPSTWERGGVTSWSILPPQPPRPHSHPVRLAAAKLVSALAEASSAVFVAASGDKIVVVPKEAGASHVPLPDDVFTQATLQMASPSLSHGSSSVSAMMITAGGHGSASPSLLSATDVAVMWKHLLEQVVATGLMTDTSGVQVAVRISLCRALAGMAAPVFPLLPRALQVICLTLVVGAVHDPAPKMRPVAVRTLAVFLTFPALYYGDAAFPAFLADATSALVRTLRPTDPTPVPTLLRERGYWALANLAQSLQHRAETAVERPSHHEELSARKAEVSPPLSHYHAQMILAAASPSTTAPTSAVESDPPATTTLPTEGQQRDEIESLMVAAMGGSGTMELPDDDDGEEAEETAENTTATLAHRDLGEKGCPLDFDCASFGTAINLALAGAQDLDKVAVNAVRALGALASLYQPWMVEGVVDCDSTSSSSGGDLTSGALPSKCVIPPLREVASALGTIAVNGGMKSRWNSCVALRVLLSNPVVGSCGVGASVDSDGSSGNDPSGSVSASLVPLACEDLSTALLSTDNYKVRIFGVQALESILDRVSDNGDHQDSLNCCRINAQISLTSGTEEERQDPRQPKTPSRVGCEGITLFPETLSASYSAAEGVLGSLVGSGETKKVVGVPLSVGLRLKCIHSLIETITRVHTGEEDGSEGSKTAGGSSVPKKSQLGSRVVDQKYREELLGNAVLALEHAYLSTTSTSTAVEPLIPQDLATLVLSEHVDNLRSILGAAERRVHMHLKIATGRDWNSAPKRQHSRIAAADDLPLPTTPVSTSGSSQPFLPSKSPEFKVGDGSLLILDHLTPIDLKDPQVADAILVLRRHAFLALGVSAIDPSPRSWGPLLARYFRNFSE